MGLVTVHTTFALLKRFVNFVNNLVKSTKMVSKSCCPMLNMIAAPPQVITCVKLSYSLIKQTLMKSLQMLNVEKWKINLAKEIIEVINRNLEMGILDTAELDDILEHILT